MVMGLDLVRKQSSGRGNASRERLVRLGIKREEGGRLFVSSKIGRLVKGGRLSKRERIKKICWLVSTVCCWQ